MHLNNNLVQDILSELKSCQFKKFVDNHFDEKFSWQIKGTSILSGKYYDKNIFMKDVIGRISSHIVGEWSMLIHNYYFTKDTLIVEMTGNASTTDGSNYNNEYCWIMHFKNNKIIHLTAYYDSLLVNKALL